MKNQILAFLGHRFNILFNDAAAVFFHNEDITSFLRMWPNPNKLLCSVKYDSFQPILLSTVRALGIVGKLITEPFEGILKATKKLLHCNPYLETIQIHLKKWSGDGDDAMKGVPVFETFTPQDAIFKKLFEKHSDPEVDAMTISAIELGKGPRDCQQCSPQQRNFGEGHGQAGQLN